MFISTVVFVVVTVAVAFCLVPRLKSQIEEDEWRSQARQKRARPQQIIIKQTKFSAEIELVGGRVNPVFEPDAKSTVQRDEICLDPNKLMQDGDPAKGAQAEPEQRQEDDKVTPADAASKSEEMVEIDLSAETSKASSQDKCEQEADKAAGGARAASGGGEETARKGGDNVDRSPAQPPVTKDKRPGADWLADSNLDNSIAKLFALLQIITACFASFAHGTNDVSNAVMPLVPIWNIYSTGVEDVTQHTPLWILVFGGIGICTGLWAWGRSVMETVGGGLTKLTPAKGFSIELGAATAVLVATKCGMPISTTHCKVGALVIVGLVSSKFLQPPARRPSGPGPTLAKHSSANQGPQTDAAAAAAAEKAVDWKLFGGIALTWLVTVPLAALSSAIIMFILRACVTVD